MPQVIGPTLIIVVVGRRMGTSDAPQRSTTHSIPLSPVSARMRPLSRPPGARGVMVDVPSFPSLDEKLDEKDSAISRCPSLNV